MAARLTRAEALAESHLQEIGQNSGEVQTEFLEGSVTEAAMAVSRTRESDLILLSAPRKGLLQRLLG